MTDAEAQDLAHGIYDSIFSSITKSPDGGKTAYDPNHTFLTMMKPGLPINPADFSNVWTPGNPTGSQTNAADLWDLVDQVPNFSALQANSGRKISEMYRQILRSTVTIVDKPDPAVKKQYDDAYNLLHTKSTDEDGKPTVIQSDLWNNYQTNQQAWSTAQSAYTAAYLAAMATPTTKGEWPILAPPLAVPVKQAYQKWRAEGADQVEAALATLQTSGAGQVQRAFADAQAQFDSYQYDIDGSGDLQHRSGVLPSDWYKATNQNGWPTTSWSHATSSTNTSSDFTSAGGGGGFSVGLWSVGGGASHQSSNFHSDATVNSVKVSYSFCLIQIKRPWMSELLFSLPGWKTDVAPKGHLSTGSRNGQAGTLFPLIPHAFIAIKNVKIHADFSKAEMDMASSKISANLSVGWGPFSVSGSYSHSHSETHAKGEVAGDMINAPFVQIIGWINQILPLSPPE